MTTVAGRLMALIPVSRAVIMTSKKNYTVWWSWICCVALIVVWLWPLFEEKLTVAKQ